MVTSSEGSIQDVDTMIDDYQDIFTDESDETIETLGHEDSKINASEGKDGCQFYFLSDGKFHEKSLPTKIKTKEDFKELKHSMDELRVRLNRSLEQTLMQLKRSGGDSKFEESISVIRNEMKSIEKVLQGFTGVLRSLDVGLGKMSLIIEQVEKFDTEAVEDSMVNTKNELEDILFEYGRVGRTSENSDNLVVDSLKSMYDSFNLMAQFDKNCEKLMDDFREEELAKNVVFTGDEELQEKLQDELQEELHDEINILDETYALHESTKMQSEPPVLEQ